MCRHRTRSRGHERATAREDPRDDAIAVIAVIASEVEDVAVAMSSSRSDHESRAFARPYPPDAANDDSGGEPVYLVNERARREHRPLHRHDHRPTRHNSGD